MANFITMSRIFLAIITVALLFIKSTPVYITAFFLTAVVIWFDGLDGFIARLLKEDSRFGAMLDILGDRIVENIYWIAFCALGFVQAWIPIVVVTRGLLTDGVRSLAFEKGYTAFGTTTMQQNPVAKFIVASRTVRFSYAIFKALAFALMILAYVPTDYKGKDVVTTVAYVCVYITVFLCVLRGIPVLLESKRFFKEDEK